MQPNIIERVWRQDKMTDVDVLNGFVFTGEAGAHKFVISGKNVNTPVSISGTITADFKNADGVIVPLTGTVEDGKAAVVLSRECYVVEGPFSLKIFADTVCIYAAIANVINSSGEVIAYPTAAIPDVHELIVEAQEIVHRLDNGYDAFPTLTVGPDDVLTVTDGADDIPLKTLSVAIEPKQDLHGYDKPWVGGAGKNLFNPALFVDRTAINVTSEVQADGTIHLSGTPSGTARYNSSTDNVILPAGTYCVTGSPNEVRIRTGSTIIDTNGVFTSDGVTPVCLNVTMVSGTAIDIYEKIQIELGSTATAYEPYANICPITGWDEVVVTRTGKNLIFTKVENALINASGVIETAPLSPNYDILIAKVESGKKYTFSGDTAFSGYNVYAYFNDIPALGSTSYNGDRTIPAEATSTTITAPIDGYLALRCVKSGGTTAMIEAGEIKTTYEAPHVQTIPVNLSTLTGSTVYGGTVTVNDDGTGTLVVDRAMVTYDGSESGWTWTSTDSLKQASITLSYAAKYNATAVTYKCNVLTPEPNNNRIYTMYNYASLISSGAASAFSAPGCGDLATFKAWAANNNIQFCYELATNQTYTLTATQLSTLLGHNTLWCDAGQVTMTYRADTKMYIDRKLAELAANT